LYLGSIKRSIKKRCEDKALRCWISSVMKECVAKWVLEQDEKFDVPACDYPILHAIR
jgi:hypothetical protein